MILHTTQPAELIFPTEMSAYCCTAARVEGHLVFGVLQGRSMTISRLVSTDPAAYLNPKFAPGQQVLIDNIDPQHTAL